MWKDKQNRYPSLELVGDDQFGSASGTGCFAGLIMEAESPLQLELDVCLSRKSNLIDEMSGVRR